MGTLLYSRGVTYDQCFDALNLTNPDLIQSIHNEYLSAGAQIIETNTFGANRVKLELHNLERKFEKSIFEPPALLWKLARFQDARPSSLELLAPLVDHYKLPMSIV